MSFNTSEYLESEPTMEELSVPEVHPLEEKDDQRKPSTSLFEIINNKMITKHELVGTVVFADGAPNNIIIDTKKINFNPVKNDLKLVKTKDFQGLYKKTKNIVLGLDKDLSEEIFKDDTSFKNISKNLSQTQSEKKFIITEMFDFDTEMEIFRDSTHIQEEDLIEFNKYLDNSKDINKSSSENEVIFLNTLQSLQFLQNFDAIEVADINKIGREQESSNNKNISQNKAKIQDGKNMIFKTDTSALKEIDNLMQKSQCKPEVEVSKCLDYLKNRNITILSLENAKKMIKDIENLDFDKVLETKETKKSLRGILVTETEQQANRITNKGKRKRIRFSDEIKEYLYLPDKPDITILREKRPRMIQASEEDRPKSEDKPQINDDLQGTSSKTGSSTSRVVNKLPENHPVTVDYFKLPFKKKYFIAKEKKEFISTNSNGIIPTDVEQKFKELNNNGHDDLFKTQPTTTYIIPASVVVENDPMSTDYLNLLQNNDILSHSNLSAGRGNNAFSPISDDASERMTENSLVSSPNIVTSEVVKSHLVLEDNLNLLQNNGALAYNNFFARETGAYFAISNPERIVENSSGSSTYEDSYNITTLPAFESYPVSANNLHLPQMSSALAYNNVFAGERGAYSAISNLERMVENSSGLPTHEDLFNTATSAEVEIYPVSANYLNLPQMTSGLAYNNFFARERGAYSVISYPERMVENSSGLLTYKDSCNINISAAVENYPVPANNLHLPQISDALAHNKERNLYSTIYPERMVENASGLPASSHITSSAAAASYAVSVNNLNLQEKDHNNIFVREREAYSPISDDASPEGIAENSSGLPTYEDLCNINTSAAVESYPGPANNLHLPQKGGASARNKERNPYSTIYPERMVETSSGVPTSSNITTSAAAAIYPVSANNLNLQEKDHNNIFVRERDAYSPISDDASLEGIVENSSVLPNYEDSCNINTSAAVESYPGPANNLHLPQKGGASARNKERNPYSTIYPERMVETSSGVPTSSNITTSAAAAIYPVSANNLNLQEKDHNNIFVREREAYSPISDDASPEGIAENSSGLPTYEDLCNINTSAAVESYPGPANNLHLPQKGGASARNKERNPYSTIYPERMVETSSGVPTSSNITTSAAAAIYPVSANNLNLQEKDHNNIFVRERDAYSPISDDASLEGIVENSSVLPNYEDSCNINTSAAVESYPVPANGLHLPQISGALAHKKERNTYSTIYPERMVETSFGLPTSSNITTLAATASYPVSANNINLQEKDHNNISIREKDSYSPISDDASSEQMVETSSVAVENHLVPADNLNLLQKDGTLGHNSLFARKRHEFSTISDDTSQVIIEQIIKNSSVLLNYSNLPLNNDLPTTNLSLFQNNSLFANQEEIYSNVTPAVIESLDEVIESHPVDLPLDLSNSSKIKSHLADLPLDLSSIAQKADRLYNNNISISSQIANSKPTVMAELIQSPVLINLDNFNVQSVSHNEALLNNKSSAPQTATSLKFDKTISTVVADVNEYPVISILDDESVSLDSLYNNNTLQTMTSSPKAINSTSTVATEVIKSVDKVQPLGASQNNDTLISNQSFGIQEAKSMAEVTESHPGMISLNVSTPKSRVVHKIDDRDFMGKYVPYVDFKSRMQLVNIFTCKLCAYSTANRSSLKYHMRVHDDDAPMFQCRNCIYQTKHPNNLAKHQNIHARDCSQTKLECKKCGLKIPHDVKKYFCFFCPYEKIYKNDRDHHMQVKHGYKVDL